MVKKTRGIAFEVLPYSKHSIFPFYYHKYDVVVINYQSSDLFFPIILFPKNAK